MQKKSIGTVLGDVLIYGIGLFAALITLIPFLHVIAMSLSDSLMVSKQEIFLIPRKIHFDAYRLVLQNKLFWSSYGNTLWIVLVGTAVNICMTLLFAYPLSRRHFSLRRPVMLAVTFTMFFSGGLIPLFITINAVGLYNSRWALILPYAISTYNLIVCRTFFEGIPESLVESAKLDGASELRILWSIILPLSQAIIAVLVLFYAVGHWNSYFPAMLFLPDGKLQPLQVYLVRVLIQESEQLAEDGVAGFSRALQVQQLKYSVIIVTILPIVILYPFLQKYFVQGVMIGAIKG
ncbi:MAG: carbohydrate ABC transporter permease [Clostridia bacterium]